MDIITVKNCYECPFSYDLEEGDFCLCNYNKKQPQARYLGYKSDDCPFKKENTVLVVYNGE